MCALQWSKCHVIVPRRKHSVINAVSPRQGGEVYSHCSHFLIELTPFEIQSARRMYCSEATGAAAQQSQWRERSAVLTQGIKPAQDAQSEVLESLRSAKLIPAKQCHPVTLPVIDSAQWRINPGQREQIRAKATLAVNDTRNISVLAESWNTSCCQVYLVFVYFSHILP